MIAIRRSDFLSSELWRIFPPINVDAVCDIPKDYPGPMGVPITVFAKFDPDQFEVLGMIRPRLNGKTLYRRALIRNLRPQLPDVIDLEELCRRCGVALDFEIE